jgi:hypothetical protein
MANDGLGKRSTNEFPVSIASLVKDDLFCTTHSSELVAAIAALYPAFENSELSNPLKYCGHCFTLEDARYLAETKVRELTLDDAAIILPSSISTLGTAADFNYFLPRILEALAYGAHYMQHVLPQKMAEGRAIGWTADQTSAVVRFLVAYVAAVNDAECPELFSYDLEGMLPELKAVLPELPAEIAVNST